MLDEPPTTAVGMDPPTAETSTMNTPNRVNLSAWAIRLHDPSPASTVTSITPRAGVNRARESISPTPMPNLGTYLDDTNVYDSDDVHHEEDNFQDGNDFVDETEEWPNDQEWGDEAMLVWDAVSRDDDVSSVDREDAGLSDDAWGRDALLAWDDEYDNNNDNNDDDDDEDDNDSIEIMHQHLARESDDDATDDDMDHEEIEEELNARGMPTYRDWTIKDLQVYSYTHSMWPSLTCRNCVQAMDIALSPSTTRSSIWQSNAGGLYIRQLSKISTNPETWRRRVQAPSLRPTCHCPRSGALRSLASLKIRFRKLEKRNKQPQAAPRLDRVRSFSHPKGCPIDSSA
jgi:hypothetical protein